MSNEILTILYTALQGAGDGAFVVDCDQKVLFWNQSAERLLGYSSAEVLGRQCYQLIGGRDDCGRPHCYKDCQVSTRSKKGEPIESHDVVTRDRDGEQVWFNLSVVPFHIPDHPKSPLLVHFFRDATERIYDDKFMRELMRVVERRPRTLRQAPEPTARTAAAHKASGLSRRELEVLRVLAEGHGTKEIASLLKISPNTVRNHLRNVFTKLGVKNRTEAVAHAVRTGLVDL